MMVSSYDYILFIIYFKTIVDNKSKDHRLRFSFGSNFEISENTIKSYYDGKVFILSEYAYIFVLL